jgi:N utilization substance protein A
MLSLAIGREGQNARLAAKLTGWRIDIRSDQAPARETDGTEPDTHAAEAAATPEPTLEETPVAVADEIEPVAAVAESEAPAVTESVEEPVAAVAEPAEAPAPKASRARKSARAADAVPVAEDAAPVEAVATTEAAPPAAETAAEPAPPAAKPAAARKRTRKPAAEATEVPS